MMIRIELADLTMGERLVVSRHRMGITQREMADRLGLTRRQAQELEADSYRGVVPQRVRDFAELGEALRLHERCVVARARTKFGVSEVAGWLGVSRQYVYEMESGREDCGRLVALWKIDTTPLAA